MSSGPDIQLIFSDNPGSLPASYDLVSDISVQSIVARIDGAGAAGSFLPTLSLYTQDGHLIARVPSDVTYAIGDTGVVTWSPFLARRVAATPSGGATIQNIGLTVAGFTTSGGGFDPIVFTGESGSYNDGVTMTLNGAGNLQIASAGVYLMHIRADTLPAVAAGSSSNLQLAWNVTAGSQGRWSSKGVGMALEGNTRWAGVIDDGAGRAIDAQGALDLFGVAAWLTTDTFPVEVTAFTTYQLNNVDQIASYNLKYSCARIGTPFV